MCAELVLQSRACYMTRQRGRSCWSVIIFCGLNVSFEQHTRVCAQPALSLLYMQVGLVLGLCPANERRRYSVTTSLIGCGASLETALCRCPGTSAINRHTQYWQQYWKYLFEDIFGHYWSRIPCSDYLLPNGWRELAGYPALRELMQIHPQSYIARTAAHDPESRNGPEIGMEHRAACKSSASRSLGLVRQTVRKLPKILHCSDTSRAFVNAAEGCVLQYTANAVMSATMLQPHQGML